MMTVWVSMVQIKTSYFSCRILALLELSDDADVASLCEAAGVGL